MTGVIIQFQSSARPFRARGGGEVTPFDRLRPNQSRPTMQTQCARDARLEWLRYRWGETVPLPERPVKGQGG